MLFPEEKKHCRHEQKKLKILKSSEMFMNHSEAFKKKLKAKSVGGIKQIGMQSMDWIFQEFTIANIKQLNKL